MFFYSCIFLFNGLITKARLISKFMTSQTGKQAIPIHILPNISRCKDNQTIKFSQLTENNMRNILLQKSCKKCGEENTPLSFSK